MIILILSMLLALAATFLLFQSIKLYNNRKRYEVFVEKVSKLIGDNFGTAHAKFSSKQTENVERDFDRMATNFNNSLAEMRKREENTAAILSTIEVGVLILNINKEVVMLNKSATDILKISNSATTNGQHFINLIRDSDLEAVVDKCIKTWQPQTGTVKLVGTGQYLEIKSTLINEKILVTLQDITNVRRLEKVRQDFIANVSHELRTPIASLKAIVETLQNGAIANKNVAKDFLNRMQVEADKLAQMVNELSELTRIESDNFSLRVHPIDMDVVIKRTTERLKAQAERAQIQVKLEVPQNIPTVLGDDNRLEQVLVNILHNAIKFTPPRGIITVAAKSESDNLLISVNDTGIGIPPDDLPRIFERFYKVDKARSGGGTGLGLAIAKHIIIAHNGRIWAESTENKGSTFFFTLPTIKS